MNYYVHLPIFDGPMELLLELIKKRKMSIHDIEISVICDDFMEKLKEMKSVNMDVTSDFISMASLLLRIKSDSLLPVHSEEKSEEDEDPKGELIARLLEYERVKEAASKLEEKAEYERLSFGRQQEDFSFFSQEELLKDADVEKLYHTFRKIISRFQRHEEAQEKLEEIPKTEYTFLEAKHHIFYVLSKKKTVFFTELISFESSLEECISLFLALLELMRRKEILVRQNAFFDDIVIQLRE